MSSEPRFSLAPEPKSKPAPPDPEPAAHAPQPSQETAKGCPFCDTPGCDSSCWTCGDCYGYHADGKCPGPRAPEPAKESEVERKIGMRTRDEWVNLFDSHSLMGGGWVFSSDDMNDLSELLDAAFKR